MSGTGTPAGAPAVAAPAWLTREPVQGGAPVLWRTSMITIRSADQPRAVRWYRNVLGFQLEFDIPIRVPNRPFRMAVLVGPDNRRVEITGRGLPKGRPADVWDTPVSVTYQVDDLDTVRSHLQAMDVPYFTPEFNGQYGRLLTLLDPDHNIIKLQAPNERCIAEQNLEDPDTPRYPDEPRYVPDPEATDA
ncbi:VOC family protein [Streptomyces sp. NPDC094448]|uniref:VOC family protein n=1 Tax=Streptomyces sp. NPDC094448 TaxID=3366063 RepID=UPI003817319E